jgi:hypothetical protein
MKYKNASVESMLTALQNDILFHNKVNKPIIKLIKEISKKKWFSRCDSSLSAGGLVLTLKDQSIFWEIRYWSSKLGYFDLSANEKENDTYDFVFVKENEKEIKRPVSMRQVLQELDEWFQSN